ncbi:MAG TPA: hypothetical protein VFV50_08810, partial [Bdellovibrionales bacterium]|nr:hypothetical protein [Bdellovibrionales bacterium]
KALVILISMALGPMASAQQFDIGGELGNPFRVYSNPAGAFETLYPHVWNVLERHASVGFVESGVSDPSQVQITALADPRASSPAALEAQLKRQFPGQAFRPIDVQGKPAFISESGESGQLYVFREPGKLLALKFKSRPNSISREFVRTTILSVSSK